ncbi:MAG: hypothetical protein ACREH8_07550, partial [Opitutaceae bacterium]
LDLTQQPGWRSWGGRHAMSAYGEFRRVTRVNINQGISVIDDHTWSNPANRTSLGANNRYYVGDNQGFNFDYAPAALYGFPPQQSLYWRNGLTGQWITEPAIWGETERLKNHNDQEVRTRGLVTQNFLFKDRLVTTFGWRRDKNRTRNPRNETIDPATGFLRADPTFPPWDERSGPTTTRGGVMRPFKGWGFIERRAETGSFLADTLRSLNLHYNESDSFTPAREATNLFGESLPLPTGEGKDYGFSLTFFSGKLHLRVNKYEAQQINSFKGNGGTFSRRALEIDFPSGPADNTSLFTFASNVVNQRFAAQGVNPTAAQFTEAVETFMQLPKGFVDARAGLSFTGGVQDTSDVTSKGYEIEANYNPSRYWTLKFNAARQQAFDANVGPALKRYIDLRLPVWPTIKDDEGNFWWIPSGSAASFTGTAANIALFRATEGQARTQTREWRFNATTSYQLAGLGSDRKWLNNLTVGGSVRWEDQASIGFLGAAPDADGIIRNYDPNGAVFDQARTYFDAWASYRLRLFKNKVGARLQFNVRNVFEGGRLQTIAVNPDGQAYGFRIIDPRQFILSATFDL